MTKQGPAYNLLFWGSNLPSNALIGFSYYSKELNLPLELTVLYPKNNRVGRR